MLSFLKDIRIYMRYELIGKIRKFQENLPRKVSTTEHTENQYSEPLLWAVP